MHALTLALFVAPAVMAATPRARSGLPKSFAQSKFLNVLATCDVGRVQCERGCMPFDAECCNDNTDEYCRKGYYCIPGACCPEGEICSGSGGGEAECDIGETECDGLCMPLTGTCCNDGLHYCPDFGKCTSDGYCCDIGDDCDEGDSSGSIPTGFRSSTATDDDVTSTTSLTTTKTSTSTTHHHTSSSTSSETSSETSETSSEETSSETSTTADSTTETPVTSAPNAEVTTSVSQQAGGIFTADGKIAAGLAVAAALLV
ncbi:uncharacterized protein F4812DRAFT_30996 [Daldinia caldariorum]|uniref:uncharacterized protein n=1 Tax=Daldinia caldariorum TaxID=326644 RepID=UPI002008D992|nr:uncharacterized protein F4812DRAFT_30996 [Daldinia caldariorum]KAI1472882.1 hypothetical protein F4812DRAFT_30996 [Daldinia caldariorum]